MSPPRLDEIEVTVLGPGFGESTVVHIGDGRWVIIDSCYVRREAPPAALVYLQSIGVSPDAVELVVATHWHDDHIGGMSQVVKACERATFCTSSILTDEEFVTTVNAYAKRPILEGGASVKEVHEVLTIIEGRKKPIKRALADRLILKLPGTSFSHGKDVEIWSLSPCDASYARFIKSLDRLLPKEYEQKKRLAALSPNECSVVIWMAVGDLNILLGADLEEDGQADRGWSAIINSAQRPAGAAKIFKIPHHGSKNAHHDAVWKEMVDRNAICVLAPFDRGSKLPGKADVDRINALSANAYATAPFQAAPKKRKKRSPVVEKLIKDMGIDVRPISDRVGMVQTRISPLNSSPPTVSLFSGALKL